MFQAKQPMPRAGPEGVLERTLVRVTTIPPCDKGAQPLPERGPDCWKAI